MKVVGVRERGMEDWEGEAEGKEGKGEQNKTGEFIASSESITYQKDPLSHWGKHLKNGDCNVSVSLTRVT